MKVRPVEDGDRAWLLPALREAWGTDSVVGRGRLTDPVSALPGLVVERDGEPAGFALLRHEGDELEVVVLQSLVERQGVGTALLAAVVEEAARVGVRRAWLVTTNDNVDALRLYQRRGWDLVALYRNALVESRRLKPQISEVGAYGIPLRHELELEYPIQEAR